MPWYNDLSGYLIGEGDPNSPAELAARRQAAYGGFAQSRGNASLGQTLDTSRADASRELLGGAAIDLGGQVDRAEGAVSEYDRFINEGPGPSAAQAGLSRALAASAAQSQALANSGRGNLGGAEAQRRASMNQAAAAGQTSAQRGVVRASEDQMWREQEAAAMRGRADAYGLQGQILGDQAGLYGALREGDARQVDNRDQYMFDRETAMQAWDAARRAREGHAFDVRAADASGRQTYNAAQAGWQSDRNRQLAEEDARRRQIQTAKNDSARNVTFDIGTRLLASDRNLKTNIQPAAPATLRRLVEALGG